VRSAEKPRKKLTSRTTGNLQYSTKDCADQAFCNFFDTLL
jgi:hypothetical protein